MNIPGLSELTTHLRRQGDEMMELLRGIKAEQRQTNELLTLLAGAKPEPVCTCGPGREWVARPLDQEPHFVGCPRWGMPLKEAGR